METPAVYEDGLPAVEDDNLIQIAKYAEARIDAVIKIKQIALKVTNAEDWVDQDGKPYLQASGSEKIAGLFDISWSFLTPEPLYEEEPDGHYSYTYRARFTMGRRFIEADGTRDSKEGFFKQNEWVNNVKHEKDVKDRDNKRDVKMAAYTNLLGNGITRILGIRNLTYADLEQFAGIKKDQVRGVKYKKDGQDKPKVTDADDPAAHPISEAQKRKIYVLLGQMKVPEDSRHGYCSVLLELPEAIKSMNDLTVSQASKLIELITEKLKDASA